MKRFPNMVDLESKYCFKPIKRSVPIPSADTIIDDIRVKKGWFGKMSHEKYQRNFTRSSESAADARKDIRIGIPRVLNLWSTGPFWRTYFESLGIRSRNVVFSDETTEEIWQAGGKYGSVDPCYPAKVVQAHIHNLFFEHHTKKPLNLIFFPALTHVPTFVEKTMDTACCPIVAGTPSVINAAFTKEKNFFEERDIEYLSPTLSLTEPLLLKKKMFDTFGEHLQVTEDESDFAIEQAFLALDTFDEYMQDHGREILNYVEKENKVAILMLGRPYHNDLGLNHGILEEFQSLGYPVLSLKSIPKDREYLDPFFKQDLASGRIDSPLEIHDVWPENYSVNSVQKVWGAKFAARHPNIAVLDLSSFKCGHDAPTYGMIDSIIGATDTPYSALHDIDANKPSGSIKIRVKTYAYTLKMAEERLADSNVNVPNDQQLLKNKLKLSIAEKELELLSRSDTASAQLQPKVASNITELKNNIMQLQKDEALKNPEDIPFASFSNAEDRQRIEVATID